MDFLFAFAAAAALSLGGAVLLVATANVHGQLSFDSPHGVQKSHSQATPRIGGLAVFMAVFAGALICPRPVRAMALTLLAGALPALAVGLVEDLTKRVHPATRLAVTFASGLVVCLVSGVHLGRIDVPLLDQLLLVAPIATLFTAFAIAGVTNAFNLIDGCHGLSGGTAVISLLSFAGIALQVGDTQLVQLALLLAASIGGFLVVNFPWGKLFLGDSGAYFTGFAVAWTAVLLVTRNPDVSPWAALLVCAYPVVEVLYSVVRRISSGARVDAPDRGHLHNVASAIVQRRMRHMPLSLQNAAASVLVWPLPIACGAAASLCYSTPPVLALLASSTVVLYHRVYRRFAVS